MKMIINYKDSSKKNFLYIIMPFFVLNGIAAAKINQKYSIPYMIFFTAALLIVSFACDTESHKKDIYSNKKDNELTEAEGKDFVWNDLNDMFTRIGLIFIDYVLLEKVFGRLFYDTLNTGISMSILIVHAIILNFYPNIYNGLKDKKKKKKKIKIERN